MGIQQLVKKIFASLGYEIRRSEALGFKPYSGYPERSIQERRFYNVGAGFFFHPFWTNIDFATDYYSSSQKYEFLNYDLMELQALPLEDASAELFYTSHTIEHVSDAAVSNMLKEIYRVLKPGGGVRLSTPNLLLEYWAYKRKDRDFWYWANWYSKKGTWEKLYKFPLAEAAIPTLLLEHIASQLSEVGGDDTAQKFSDAQIDLVMSTYTMEDALDYFTSRCKYNPNYPGNHMNWWTAAKLTKFLNEAGFNSVIPSGYGQSIFQPLRDVTLFDLTHPKMSLYVDAIK